MAGGGRDERRGGTGHDPQPKARRDIEVVPVGRPMAGDLKANSVRIFVDTVAEVPFVG